MIGRRRWPTSVLLAVSLATLAASLLLALSLGSSEVMLGDVLALVRDQLLQRPLPEAEQLTATIVWSLRAPRALVAALCGGALAVAGVVSQGLFRNGLASPSVLGTEAGGSLAAVVTFYLGAAYAHWLTLPLAAFGGALAATALIFRAAARGPGASLETLLLMGFAVNAMLAAATSLVVSLVLEDHAAAGAVLHWLLGGFTAKGWEHLAMGAVPAAIGLTLALRLAPRLDVLALGEDVASTLSVDVRGLRRGAVVSIAALVATAVGIGGTLPFVGLLVPHLTRLAAGPRHRLLIVLSALNGMTLVVLADLLARTLRAPSEIEVGVLTSLVGAPFFLALLFERARAR
jgi:iron complex transport system permease protein